MPNTQDKYEVLDYAERWFRDGTSVAHPPGAFVSLEIDMSETREFRAALKRSGIDVTWTHILVQATAAALTANPDLHQLTAGNRRLRPSSVDVCVSVATDSAITAVMVVKDAGRKGLEDIATEVRTRAGEVRKEDERFRNFLRRWGWVIPFTALRRAILSRLLNRTGFRRKLSGTFQLTVVPTVDVVVPLLFNTTGVLAAGAIRDRVIAVDGRPVVRPTMILTCCFDHAVWNGQDAARFLNAVKASLEQPAILSLDA